MATPLIDIKGLHKRFGDLHVLRGVDLEIHRGDRIAIIGGSGSGKSTMLRCLNFMEIPTAGQITFDGKAIGERIGASAGVGVAPNELIEIRPDGALVLQVIPEAPGRCRIRRFEFGIASPTREQRCLHYLGRRLVRRWLQQDFTLAQSIQAGLEGSSFEATEAGPVPQALRAFRSSIFGLLSGIHTPPSEAPLG